MLAFGELVAGSAENFKVETGFLELSDPPAGVALDRLINKGAKRIAVVPLMLNGGGHSKSDVPAVVLEARLRHPKVAILYGRPLGLDTRILSLAAARISDVRGNAKPLAVIARGTSEPEANADAFKVSRLLAEACSSPLVMTGFSGVTWPDVPTVLGQLEVLGAKEIVCFAWFLFTGLLIQRMKSDFHDFARRTGVQVIDAGYLGPSPELVPVVLERAKEALEGQATMTCDTCSYRLPFPGLEERVGTPLGQGHSHLAEEHRHHHH
jgi:sirohydrochlorin cobaltochelatase